jgi:hypothetical protein
MVTIRGLVPAASISTFLFAGGDGGRQVHAHSDRHHAQIHDHL